MPRFEIWDLRFEISRNNNPVVVSTNGYCQEIFVLQAKHFPRRKTKLAMGRSSYHFNFLAQVKHFDRPKTIDWPVFKRKMTTLRKLPTTAPKRKIKMETKRLSIDFIISQKKSPETVGGFL